MRDDDSFEFDQDQRGSSTFPAVLLAAVAIAAILFVNTTAPASASTAGAPSTPEAASVKVIPALLDDVQPPRAPLAVRSLGV